MSLRRRRRVVKLVKMLESGGTKMAEIKIRAQGRHDHYLVHEDKDKQREAAREIVRDFLGRHRQVNAYDCDIGRIFFTEYCETKDGRRWKAQTAHLKVDVDDGALKIQFTTPGWEP